MKTYMQTPSDIKRAWHVIDVKGLILGRIATKVATLLIGKHKPVYTPHMDSGDYVVVTNAQQIELTRGKENKKVYYRHSGFPGNLQAIPFKEQLAEHPERIIEQAVFNMLPKNKLRNERMKRLKVYPAAEHPHGSQLG